VGCTHDRVVRLEVSGKDFWICNLCNEQFVSRQAVDYKLCHLTTELAKRIVDEQAEGMRGEEEF
jgi:hypothetical protein